MAGMALAGATVLVCVGCLDNKLEHVKQFAPGHMNVAGSVRAQGTRYRLISTLGAAGGPRATAATRSHDGLIVNGHR
jgi:hypothetical protein